MYGIIYAITNTLNNKQYVGQTTSDIQCRWYHHLRTAKNVTVDGAIQRAIHKYSEIAFKVEQIDSAESLHELNEKEAYYIDKLGTLVPNGYNLTTGGERGTFSHESRKKNSESNKGRIRSQESRRKQSESMKGHIVSLETRQKLSKIFS